MRNLNTICCLAISLILTPILLEAQQTLTNSHPRHGISMASWCNDWLDDTNKYAEWGYTWDTPSSTNPNSCGNVHYPDDFQFVPMLTKGPKFGNASYGTAWGNNQFGALPSVSELTTVLNGKNHPYWLVFNECNLFRGPDNSGNHHTCSSEADLTAEFYYNTVLTRLSSACTSSGKSFSDQKLIIGGTFSGMGYVINNDQRSLDWLKDFVVHYYTLSNQRLIRTGWHFHVYNTHVQNDVSIGLQEIKDFITWLDAYETAKFGSSTANADEIWITEMGSLSGSLSVCETTMEDDYMAYFHSDEGKWITRYAWFSNAGSWSANYLLQDHSTKNLNDLGKQYQDYLYLGEVGQFDITQTSSTYWKTVNFQKEYTDPVVYVNGPSFNDGDPVTIKTKNVTSTSFQVQIDEWVRLLPNQINDGIHGTETVNYMVVERGTHTLQNGGKIIAGSTTVTGAGWKTVSYGENLYYPAVFASLRSTNSVPKTLRINNVSSTSAKLKLQCEERYNWYNQYNNETVDYIIIEYPQNAKKLIGDNSFNTKSVFQSNGLIASHVWRSNVSNEKIFVRKDHIGFASMQTTKGGDPCNLRIVDKPGNYSYVKIQEEQSYDTEVAHTTENIRGFSVNKAGLLARAMDESFMGGANINTDQASTLRTETEITQLPDNDELTVDLHPNPVNSSGQLNLKLESSFEVNTTTIKLFSLDGKLLIEQNFTSNSSRSTRHSLNLENIPAGIYFTHIIVNDGTYQVTKKVIVTED